jgi:hypothetical protein
VIYDRRPLAAAVSILLLSRITHGHSADSEAQYCVRRGAFPQRAN